MNRLLRMFCMGALGLLLTGAAAWAQSTGELAGRVTDESGAVLPGVTVTATQTDTGFTRTVVTDGEGAWVDAEHADRARTAWRCRCRDSAPTSQTGIVLQVGATPTLNAQLAVGNLEETVSVEAAAPIVDVRSAGISDVVENERIVELPLQGRQVTDLIVLAGAAVQTGTSDSRSMQGGVSISVAGGLSFGVAYMPRRRHAQQPAEQREPADAVPGRAAGVQRRDERVVRAERRPLGRVGQRRHQVGHQRAPRQRLRVLPRSPVQRDRSVRPASDPTASAWTTV